MNTVFPFGFPFATAFYLTLYVLTLVVHVVFMNYVLAGSAYVAVVTLRARRAEARASSNQASMLSVLADWLPFGLSAAITAGVAPLLFVQILYRKNFYTANLLLFHRWMAILPVLIVGFYLLYLIKTDVIGRWAKPVRALIAFGALACFAFTGWSWTENHLLSLEPGVWSGFYATRANLYAGGQLWPRLLMWLVGSIPTMALLVAWQLHGASARGLAVGSDEVRKISILALSGLGGCAVFGLWYGLLLDADARGNVLGVLAGPYLLLAVIGVAIQCVVWWRQSGRPAFSAGRLGAASAGVLFTLIGMTVVREVLRLSAIDVTGLYGQHSAAAEVGGRAIFGLFLVINTLLIGGCVVMVRRTLRPAQERAALSADRPA